MKLKMYSIYDSKGSFYSEPFYNFNVGDVLRSWEITCNDLKSSIGQFPADYTLFEIGTFDKVTGQIVLHSTKINLGNGIEMKKPVTQGQVSSKHVNPAQEDFLVPSDRRSKGGGLHV